MATKWLESSGAKYRMRLPQSHLIVISCDGWESSSLFIGHWQSISTALTIGKRLMLGGHFYLHVWDVCYIIFCYVLHIHSGKTEILFSSLFCSFWWVQIVVYVMACRSYSFVCTLHHRIIIIVQTYLWTLNLWNVCQIYFVECVSKIEHILLVIHYSIYGAVCFQFTQFPRDGWENILLCLIIFIKSEVWTIIHCLGLGHETMVCAVCLFIFFLMV